MVANLPLFMQQVMKMKTYLGLLEISQQTVLELCEDLETTAHKAAILSQKSNHLTSCYSLKIKFKIKFSQLQICPCMEEELFTSNTGAPFVQKERLKGKDSDPPVQRKE